MNSGPSASPCGRLTQCFLPFSKSWHQVSLEKITRPKVLVQRRCAWTNRRRLSRVTTLSNRFFFGLNAGKPFFMRRRLTVHGDASIPVASFQHTRNSDVDLKGSSRLRFKKTSSSVKCPVLPANRLSLLSFLLLALSSARSLPLACSSASSLFRSLFLPLALSPALASARSFFRPLSLPLALSFARSLFISPSLFLSHPLSLLAEHRLLPWIKVGWKKTTHSLVLIGFIKNLLV